MSTEDPEPYAGQVIINEETKERWVYTPQGTWVKWPRITHQFLLTIFSDGSTTLLPYKD